MHLPVARRILKYASGPWLSEGYRGMALHQLLLMGLLLGSRLSFTTINAVADAVNAKLNSLQDEDPSKNRETGLEMMAMIKQELQNPERIMQIIDDVMREMKSEIS